MDDREAEIEIRWARAEADSELREVKLEQREKIVCDLELRLGKRETDLAQYVGELQIQMEERESDWWEKQLGRPVADGRCPAARASAQLGHGLCPCPRATARGLLRRADPSTERSFLGQTAQPPRRPLRLEGERSRVRYA